jgi:hypothetical protein
MQHPDDIRQLPHFFVGAGVVSKLVIDYQQEQYDKALQKYKECANLDTEFNVYAAKKRLSEAKVGSMGGFTWLTARTYLNGNLKPYEYIIVEYPFSNEQLIEESLVRFTVHMKIEKNIETLHFFCGKKGVCVEQYFTRNVYNTVDEFLPKQIESHGGNFGDMLIPWCPPWIKRAV